MKSTIGTSTVADSLRCVGRRRGNPLVLGELIRTGERRHERLQRHGRPQRSAGCGRPPCVDRRPSDDRGVGHRWGGDRYQLHRSEHLDALQHRGRAGRRLWFTNAANNSIGRISTAGVVTNFTDPTISQPASITLGPDGALWFTNAGNNSIGRITTSGVVTNFTDPTFSSPGGSPPDRMETCGSPTSKVTPSTA